ncbi:MAG: hypothetical protein MZV65_29005 [Chromatiales bacterium]|nr:hypothetical protein [Chromatiales bacterium]
MRVRIDRTAPSVNYAAVGSYAGFAPSAIYTDDGIANHSSMVILPDVYTGDVNFVVTTPDADVESIALRALGHRPGRSVAPGERAVPGHGSGERACSTTSRTSTS